MFDETLRLYMGSYDWTNPDVALFVGLRNAYSVNCTTGSLNLLARMLFIYSKNVTTYVSVPVTTEIER